MGGGVGRRRYNNNTKRTRRPPRFFSRSVLFVLPQRRFVFETIVSYRRRERLMMWPTAVRVVVYIIVSVFVKIVKIVKTV